MNLLGLEEFEILHVWDSEQYYKFVVEVDADMTERHEVKHWVCEEFFNDFKDMFKWNLGS